MADNFNMKQYLAENKLGAYSRLKEDIGGNIGDAEAEKEMDFLAEREVIYVVRDGKCYRKDDEGNMDEVPYSYCKRYAEGKEEKVEEASQGSLMIINRVEEIVNNLARNISTNSNIPTQEKIGLVQALKELKDLVEDLGADAEQEEDEYVSDYSRRRASELKETSLEEDKYDIDAQSFGGAIKSDNPEGDALVLRFLKGIAQKFDYPVGQAALFVKERLKKLGY